MVGKTFGHLTDAKPERGALFVDISDSTALYRNHGDHAGDGLVRRCLEMLWSVVETNGGEVNAQIGDELLCLFDEVAGTVSTAAALQQTLQQAKVDNELPPQLNIRVGFHYGVVGFDGGRVFGDTVHTAKRMVEMAKPQQVVTTAATMRVLAESHSFITRWLAETRLKGHTEVVEVVEVVWDPMVATARGLGEECARAQGLHRLELAFRDLEIVLDAARPRLRIGRDPHCDLVVNQAQVSRFHAGIELTGIGFMLTDMSTNGTQVCSEGGAVRVLHREDCRLTGKGHLVLSGITGAPGGARGEKCEPIAYRCTEPGEGEGTP